MIALAPAALAFMPPLDRALRYEIVESRPARSGDSRYTLREEVRFTRDGDGYLLTMRATSYDLTAPPATRALLDATMKPILDLPVRIHLTAGGVPDRVIDGAGIWAAFVTAMRTRAARGHDAGLAHIVDTLAALPPATRDAQLMENADHVLAPHLPPLAPGQLVVDGGATVSRGADLHGAAQFRRATEQAAPGDTGRLATDDDFTLAPATGLVEHRLRRVRLTPANGGAAVTVSVSETRMVK